MWTGNGFQNEKHYMAENVTCHDPCWGQHWQHHLRLTTRVVKFCQLCQNSQFFQTFWLEDSRCPDSIKLSTGISIFNPGHKLSEMCNPTHHCQIQMCRLAITLNADWVCFVGCLSLVHRYLLQPKGNGKSKTDDLGSLRLNVTYTEDNVLPSACYTPLRTLLLKSPDIKVLTSDRSCSHTWSAWMVHYAH